MSARANESRREPGSESGWSLTEVAAGVALSMLIALGALALTNTSRTGAATARATANHTGWLRQACAVLREDFSQTTQSRLVVTKAAGQNDVVTLQRPLPTGGWGAYDPEGGPTRHLPDYYIRYRVGTEGTDRVLLRQILDNTMVEMSEQVVARGLASGAGTPPGLRVDPAGTMWRITVGFTQLPGQAEESITFDVALRN
jgi:hypothetical protein